MKKPKRHIHTFERLAVRQWFYERHHKVMPRNPAVMIGAGNEPFEYRPLDLFWCSRCGAIIAKPARY